MDISAELARHGEAFTVERHPDHAAWLAARRRGIGGSDAPGLWLPEIERADQRSFASPMSVYASKIADAGDEADGDNERMRIGHHVEPAVASLYAEVTGSELVDLGRTTILRSRERPWLCVSIDRVIDTPDPGVLECKWRAAGASEWADAPPLDVQIQVQHALAVLGWTWGAAAALVGGRFVHFEIPRDDGFIREHLRRCEELWQRVERRDPPEADGHPATTEALARMFPRTMAKEEVELPSGAAAWAQVYEEACDEIGLAEKVKAAMHNKIVRAIGTAEIGRLPDGARYSLRQTERKGYTVAATSYRQLRRMKKEKNP